MMRCSECCQPYNMATRSDRRLSCQNAYCTSCLVEESMTAHEPLPELPPEILLAVFRLLSRRDLLLCVRGVCRRWRSLASDRLLWERQRLTWSGLGWDGEVIATLEFAPCVMSFTVYHPASDSNMWNAISATDCAISELSIDVHRSVIPPMRAPMVVRTVQRQVELGRLRELQLNYVPRSCAGAYTALALMADLTSLTLSFEEGPGVDHPVGAPADRNLRCPSLKKLYYCSHTDDELLEFLLLAHQESLESVEVADAMYPRAVRALCGCRRLRKARLRIEYPDALLGLTALPLLTDLTLGVGRSAPPLATLAASFRRATKLERLDFPFPEEGGVSPGVLDLLRALSSTGRSALKELRIGSVVSSPDSPGLERLPSVLPGLRQLQFLYLMQMLPFDAMDSITPGSAPSLRLLCFLEMEQLVRMCPFDVCSFPALFDLVRRNRRLHVGGLAAVHDCEPKPCKCCIGGLHPPYAGPLSPRRHCCLFGHKEEEECGSGDIHTNTGSQCLTEIFCRCNQEWRFVS